MMTPADLEALRTIAHADPACAEAIAARDLDALAAILSAGRTAPSDVKIGNGTILDQLGLVDGTALLDYINTEPSMRYVKPLLEQGRLEISKQSVQDAIRAMAAGGVTSQANADKLIALGFAPAPVSRLDVEAALFNPDGTLK